MIKTILFDLDGTLVDSHLDITAALNHVLCNLGCQPHSPDHVKRMIGSGAHRLLSRALEDQQLVDHAYTLFKDAYHERLLDHTELYPGIVEMLELLRQDRDLLIATNKPSFFTERVVRGLELDQLGISSWACGDEVPHKKPDPAIVRLALARAKLELNKEEIAFVGDMPIDIQTAKRFGCLAIGVAWGFDPEGTLSELENESQWASSPEGVVSIVRDG